MANKLRTGKRAKPNSDATRTLATVPSMPTTDARTETEDKLWEALRANSHRPTAELAELAGIGRSTAGKILARWADDGTVTRTPGIATGGRRAADIWAIENAEGSKTAAPTAASPQGDPPSTAADRTETAEPSPNEPQPTDEPETAGEPEPAQSHRLSPGALRGLVEDFQRDSPEGEFSPSQIAKHLNRSAGAVNNALERLTADGVAVKTKEKPKRFGLANGQT